MQVAAAAQRIRKEIDMVHTNMTAGHDGNIKRYKFLNPGLTPDGVAQRAVQGVLLDQEHIYVPSWFGLIHFLLRDTIMFRNL
ncbi:unnamed protein product [Allacma fusca]|uniref:Uncharacterized protein n=1 Tax=Allacma fusca TaxID=39272 RepID=A0A8J2KW04_9HEXA|nr:unnamed protein product [Allacma fusca]